MGRKGNEWKYEVGEDRYPNILNTGRVVGEDKEGRGPWMWTGRIGVAWSASSWYETDRYTTDLYLENFCIRWKKIDEFHTRL